MTTLKAQFIKNLPNLPKTVQVACATFNWKRDRDTYTADWE